MTYILWTEVAGNGAVLWALDARLHNPYFPYHSNLFSRAFRWVLSVLEKTGMKLPG